MKDFFPESEPTIITFLKDVISNLKPTEYSIFEEILEINQDFFFKIEKEVILLEVIKGDFEYISIFNTRIYNAFPGKKEFYPKIFKSFWIKLKGKQVILRIKRIKILNIFEQESINRLPDSCSRHIAISTTRILKLNFYIDLYCLIYKYLGIPDFVVGIVYTFKKTIPEVIHYKLDDKVYSMYTCIHNKDAIQFGFDKNAFYINFILIGPGYNGYNENIEKRVNNSYHGQLHANNFYFLDETIIKDAFYLHYQKLNLN